MAKDSYRVENARKTNSRLRPDGYLYILRLKGFDIYKIGVSANPKRRIRDIDSISPFEIEILCCSFIKNVYNLEECIHDSFNKNKLRHEWYKIHYDDIKNTIAHVQSMSRDKEYLIKR